MRWSGPLTADVRRHIRPVHAKTLLLGIGLVSVAIVATPAILSLNYRSTLWLSPISYGLVGLAFTLVLVGTILCVKSDSNPRTGFSYTANMRRDQPRQFFVRSLLLVVAASSVAAAATWYALRVAVPLVPGSNLTAAGTMVAMQKQYGRGRSCNIIASLTLQGMRISSVDICYEWGRSSPSRISDDMLSPGDRINAIVVDNRLGAAVTALNLVKQE